MNVKTKKNPKGLVNIESVKGRLRLRWRYQGKQLCLATGYPDTPECRAAAQILANKIWLDIVGGYFDPTLDKYRQQPLAKKNSPTLLELITNFINNKINYTSSRSLEKYRTLSRRLAKAGLAKLTASELDEAAVAKIYTKLRESGLGVATVKIDLWLLNAVLRFADIDCKPLTVALKAIKAPPKQSAKPFAKDEVGRILETFETMFPHYLPYVTFLMNTGVRTAEAVGLRWKHVADDCSSFWVGETLSRGRKSDTKTHKARVVPCNQTVKSLLLNARAENTNPNGLVFTSPRGYGIQDSQFSMRYWKPALAAANVEYRKPYNCRHTFISHCLESGLSPITVSSVTGHNVQTMYAHYVGVVCLPQIPDLL